MDDGTRQVETWAGEFGRAYTDRNIGDPELRADAFTELLGGLELGSILEVGCNRGQNLAAVGRGSTARLVGVDVNPYALDLARREAPVAEYVEAQAAELPFPDASFDLVFTVGVLIHVSPESLARVLAEIVRVSARFVLAAEYFAESEEVVHYRGRDDLLWRRDFHAAYLGVEPRLALVRSGYLGPERGFDRCHWWLLEKPGA